MSLSKSKQWLDKRRSQFPYSVKVKNNINPVTVSRDISNHFVCAVIEPDIREWLFEDEDDFELFKEWYKDHLL